MADNAEITQGNPLYQNLFREWKKNGEARRFTLTNGKQYSARKDNGETIFKEIDLSSSYGSTSLHGPGH